MSITPVSKRHRREQRCALLQHCTCTLTAAAAANSFYPTPLHAPLLLSVSFWQGMEAGGYGGMSCSSRLLLLIPPITQPQTAVTVPSACAHGREQFLLVGREGWATCQWFAMPRLPTWASLHLPGALLRHAPPVLPALLPCPRTDHTSALVGLDDSNKPTARRYRLRSYLQSIWWTDYLHHDLLH